MHTPPAHRTLGLGLMGVISRIGLIGMLGLIGMFGPFCPSSQAGSAQPGPLLDPTRPPGAAPAAAATGNRPARTGSTKPDNATPNPEPSVALHSVLLQGIQTSSRHPPSAMVDGQLIKVGDSVAGRTVLAIDSQGLLLRGPAGHERLWLLTDSPKQTAGSITTTRSAVYQPAPGGPDGAAEADAVQRAGRTTDRTADRNTDRSPERNPSRSPNTAIPAGNAAALSLVGRTTP